MSKPDFLNTDRVGGVLIPVEYGGWGAWAIIGSINRVFLKSTWDHPSAEVPYFIISIDANMDHVGWPGAPYNQELLNKYKAEAWNQFIISKDLFYKNNLGRTTNTDTLNKLVEENALTWLIAKVKESNINEALYNNPLIQSYVINTLKPAYPNSQEIQKTASSWISKQTTIAKN
jgi:hypothetical protein